MKDEKVQNYIEWILKNWYEPFSLILTLPLTFYLVYEGSDFLFGKCPIVAIKNHFWEVQFGSALFCTIAVLFGWLFSRRAPRRRKDKIGIVIAIRDNSTEAEKVKKDVIDKFREIISELPSGTLIELVVLKDFLARTVTDEKSAVKMSNKTRSQFVIWGKSMNYGKQYKFDLHFIVRHRPLNLQEKNIVRKGFAESFVNKNWEFLEKNIFTCITTTAQNIREVALYVIGIAAHLSYDFDTSLKLHNDLFVVLRSDKDKRRELSVVNSRLPHWLADTYMIIGWQQYFTKNLDKAIELTNQALIIQPSHYGGKLNMALYLFQKGNVVDAKKIIKSIKKANAKINSPDSAWRYSEAFLMMLDGQLDRAFKLYQKALAGYVTNFTLDNLISFLVDFLKENPGKKQFIFILGLIYQKKKDNLPMAMVEFEKFLRKTKNDPAMSILRERAKQALREIYKALDLKENKDVLN